MTEPQDDHREPPPGIGTPPTHPQPRPPYRNHSVQAKAAAFDLIRDILGVRDQTPLDQLEAIICVVLDYQRQAP